VDESAETGAVSVRNAHGSRSLPVALLTRLAQTGQEVLKIMEARYLDRVKPPGAVSIVLIDDVQIGRVHEKFMGDANPTDVITFPYGEHGEILISIDTAERQASQFKASVDRELALYVVHGILHLCGYEDETESGRRGMTELQEGLLEEVFEGA